MKFEKRTDELLPERDNLKVSGNGVYPRERHGDASGDEPAIPHIDGLDVAGALKCLDGDRKLYLRMLRTFFENPSSTATDIEDALSAGDTKLALHHAGSIKCIAGTMGAIELERLALAVKNAVIFDEPPERVRVALKHFGTELERLVTDLAILLQASPQAVDDLLPDTAAAATAYRLKHSLAEPCR